MVTSTRADSQLMIVARPNRSASWQANIWALVAISIPSLGIAIAFALAGAWPVLPFAGLEMLALGAGLYYCNWKLQYRQVITLSDDTVRIDKGFYRPRRSWKFPRTRANLSITPERHPWESPVLTLHEGAESVNIGEFLNRDDSLKLADLLRAELRVGTFSERSRRSF